MRRTTGVAALLTVTLLTVLGGGAARAGGSIRCYVLLPSQGRVATVDAEAQRVVGTIAVPRGSGPIAASVDGSRVLVANTRRGVITQLNGIVGRRVRTFSGLGHPVDIALVPSSAGLVRSRYAIVADARGSLDVLDLDAGHVVRRIAVDHPIALAIGNNQLWVASAGETRLTVLDLSSATRPRIVERPQTGLRIVALAVDSDVASGVNGATRDGQLMQIDGVSLHRRPTARIRGTVTQLLAGYNGEIWLATSDGRVHGVQADDGQPSFTMRTQQNSQLTIALGALVVAHGDVVRMFDLGYNRRARATIRLPGLASSISFAVLP